MRPNIWLISWQEETGTTVSLCLDIDQKRITTFMSFSHGHWERNEEAKGYKRENLEKWRELALDKPEPRERVPLPEQANIDKVGRDEGFHDSTYLMLTICACRSTRGKARSKTST